MKKRNKILVVDDAEINRSMLTDILCEEYEIIEAGSGIEAVNVISRRYDDISLVLLDIVMPEMDGFEVLAVMQKNGWLDTIPVIMISAETSASYIDHAYDLGATEYISRPFDEKTVKHRVKNTIMLYSKQKALENMVTEQILEKEKNNLVMVDILSHIVEFRNGESGLHVLHIRVMTEVLLKHLRRITSRYDLSPSRIALITNASALHDIGKISIPEHILNKPGKLTAEEYEIMKNHSAMGAQILENTPYHRSEALLKTARDICRWHHERYDGNGYPDGLKGEEIPIEAQVVSLADVYDALINERIYKPAFSHQKAMQMIMDGECGTFNPLLLQCLVSSAPFLEKELAVRSAGGISKMEIQNISRELLQNGTASNRTLALLEQERIKYQFFASMSKEIQFEYNFQSDILTMSEWGASYLGISEAISHPQESAELQNVFSKKDYQDLKERIHIAVPQDPVVSYMYCLNVKGEKRWHKAVARPLWVGEDAEELTGVIGKFTDVHDEQLELDKFRLLSRNDVLTGLYNSAFAHTMIEQAIETTKGEKKFALMLLDLDNFKEANDKRGHLFGDRVLKAVAGKIKAVVGGSDIVARVGGDEFLIFLEIQDEAGLLVEEIFHAIAGEYEGFPISISMGVALTPNHGSKYEILFHHADQALYAAKKFGRRCYRFYDESMSQLLSVLSSLNGY